MQTSRGIFNLCSLTKHLATPAHSPLIGCQRRSIVSQAKPHHHRLGPRGSFGTVKLGSAFSTTPVSPEMAAELRAKADSLIADNRVVVVGKSWCSFSRRAVMTLKPLAEDMVNWDIDLTDNESLIQDYLQSKTGQRTVPFIWINQTFIGGNSDLQRIPQSQLKQLINKKPAPSA